MGSTRVSDVCFARSVCRFGPNRWDEWHVEAPESLDGRFGEPQLKQYEVTARGPSTQQGPAVAETSDAFHEAA